MYVPRVCENSRREFGTPARHGNFEGNPPEAKAGGLLASQRERSSLQNPTTSIQIKRQRNMLRNAQTPAEKKTYLRLLQATNLSKNTQAGRAAILTHKLVELQLLLMWDAFVGKKHRKEQNKLERTLLPERETESARANYQSMGPSSRTKDERSCSGERDM